MDFEPALVEELKSIPELENRIYPLFAPEATKYNGVPYLIYGSSEGIRDKSLDGYMNSKEVRAELNVVTESYGELKSITKQVIDLLVSFEQRTIGTNGPYIKELEYQMPIEIYENQPNLYRCMIEFSAYFDEEE